MNNFGNDNSKIFDYNLEIRILATLFFDNSHIEDLKSEIFVDDFYDSKHKEIFKLMIELNNNKISFDPTIFLTYAKQKEKLNEIGGEKYITEICDYAFTSIKIDGYKDFLKELSIRRQIIQISEDVKYKSFQGINSNDLIDNLEQNINKINSRKGLNNIISIGELANVLVPQLSDKTNLNDTIKTGYDDLDTITLNGFHNSDLIIMAARPGMGKTALALNIALNVSKKNKKVLLFTLEMANDQLFQRLISMEAMIGSNVMRTKNFTTDQLTKIVHAADTISSSGLYIADTSSVTIIDIKQMARKMKRENNLDLIIIDYLQLIENTKSDNKNREQQVSEVSRSLKILAKELNVPIIALAQLSRGVESRADNRPLLSDIRESGSIEQDADLVMFMYRDKYYNPKEQNGDSEITEVIIRKHRHGQQGTVYLVFNPNYQKFTTASYQAIQSYETRQKQNSNNK